MNKFLLPNSTCLSVAAYPENLFHIDLSDK